MSQIDLVHAQFLTLKAELEGNMRKNCAVIRSYTQYRILGTLGDCGTLSHAELSEASRTLGPALSRIVPKLVEAGFIREKRCSSDARRFYLRITRAGVAELRKVERGI